MKSVALFSALIGTAFFPVEAHEGHHESIVRRSACGGGVTSQVAAEPANGRIKVEYEVDNAQPGEIWKIVIRKNNKVILRTRKRVDAEGEAEVSVLTANENGNDRIIASAVRVGGGGSCEAKVVVTF